MIGASGEEMTRAEAEAQEADELIAWAREFAPDMLPEEEDDDEQWAGVIDALRAAKFTADRMSNPASWTPGPGEDFAEEPF